MRGQERQPIAGCGGRFAEPGAKHARSFNDAIDLSPCIARDQPDKFRDVSEGWISAGLSTHRFRGGPFPRAKSHLCLAKKLPGAKVTFLWQRSTWNDLRYETLLNHRLQNRLDRNRPFRKTRTEFLDNGVNEVGSRMQLPKLAIDDRSGPAQLRGRPGFVGYNTTAAESCRPRVLDVQTGGARISASRR
jgi:hypothetical protein